VKEREEWGQKSERKEPAIGVRVKSIKTKRLARGEAKNSPPFQKPNPKR
jgi:hypothetical protein